MGRVYKALVRADRWSDREHAIGSTISNDRANVSIKGQPAPPVSPAIENRPARPELVSEDSPSLAVRVASAAPALRRAPVTAQPKPHINVAPTTKVFEEPAEIHNISSMAIAPHLVTLAGTDALAADRYRTLAARLLSMSERSKLKTFLITSAEASEGKTTVAVNLAWSLAKRPERRVLLLDVNTGSRAMSHALGIAEKNNSAGRNGRLMRLDPNGLYVLRQAAPSASALAELASRFDIVVVDSQSILESPDTQNLAASLDGTIIVARAGRTDRRKVTAARKLVPKSKRLGLVLNEIDLNAEGPSARVRKRSLFGKR